MMTISGRTGDTSNNHGADEYQNHAHDGRHKVVGRLHLRIIEHSCVDVSASGIHEYLLRIVLPLHRHIGVGTIDDHLNTTFFTGKILCENYCHIRLLTANRPFSFLWRGDGAYDVEIFRGGESLHGRPSLVVHLRSYHHRAHILYVGGDGKAEDEHQHHGHAEKDEHRALVAQDVLGLLDDETPELFHLTIYDFTI